MHAYNVTLEDELLAIITAKDIPSALSQARADYGRVYGLEVTYAKGPLPAEVLRALRDGDEDVPVRREVTEARIVARYANSDLTATEFTDRIVVCHNDGSIADELLHVAGPEFAGKQLDAARLRD